MGNQKVMARHGDLSWMETLGSEHARLGALFNKLGSLLKEQADAQQWHKLVALLEDLVIHCHKHMEFEEREGYLSGILDRSPNVAGQLETLRSDHVVLQEELAGCLDEARSAAANHALNEPLRVRIKKWLNDMRDHEFRENTLVQEVFNTDIGSSE